jgi:hypothetical protein
MNPARTEERQTRKRGERRAQGRVTYGSINVGLRDATGALDQGASQGPNEAGRDYRYEESVRWGNPRQYEYQECKCHGMWWMLMLIAEWPRMVKSAFDAPR